MTLNTEASSKPTADDIAQGVANFFEADAKSQQLSSSLHRLAIETRATIRSRAGHAGLRKDEALAACNEDFLRFFNDPRLPDPLDRDDHK